MEKIKELKRKQKIKQAKIYSELGRMLTERFPGITPDTFDEFIASKATGNEVLPTPRQGEKPFDGPSGAVKRCFEQGVAQSHPWE